MFVVAER